MFWSIEFLEGIESVGKNLLRGPGSLVAEILAEFMNECILELARLSANGLWPKRNQLPAECVLLGNMHYFFESETGVPRSDSRNNRRFINSRPGIKKLLGLMVVLVMSFGAVGRAADKAPTPAEQLGWEMAIHERTFQHFTLFEAMDKTVALGLRYMSFSAGVNLGGAKPVSVLNLSDQQIQEIKDRAKAKGLKFVNAYVPFPANEAKCRQSFEFARKMGLDTLVGEPEPEALDTVEKLCKEYNIRVAIHDHPKPSHYWNPQTLLEAIKGRSPLLGACADTGHWIRSGLDPVECLKILQGHVFCLHFKDLNEQNPKAHDVPWGTGVGQAKAMMAELKRQGFHGAYCVEYEYHWDTSTPEIAECVKFFNQTCAELAANTARH